MLVGVRGHDTVSCLGINNQDKLCDGATAVRQSLGALRWRNEWSSGTTFGEIMSNLSGPGVGDIGVISGVCGSGCGTIGGEMCAGAGSTQTGGGDADRDKWRFQC